ncbi:hypothetical protein HPB50_029213 [Hyalomma asiaticum]|nr:hypothetical protein HPB50_029213 [Hyalomma asiaticum]
MLRRFMVCIFQLSRVCLFNRCLVAGLRSSFGGFASGRPSGGMFGFGLNDIRRVTADLGGGGPPLASLGRSEDTLGFVVAEPSAPLTPWDSAVTANVTFPLAAQAERGLTRNYDESKFSSDTYLVGNVLNGDPCL